MKILCCDWLVFTVSFLYIYCVFNTRSYHMTNHVTMVLDLVQQFHTPDCKKINHTTLIRNCIGYDNIQFITICIIYNLTCTIKMPHIKKISFKAFNLLNSDIIVHINTLVWIQSTELIIRWIIFLPKWVSLKRNWSLNFAVLLITIMHISIPHKIYLNRKIIFYY